MRNPFELIVLLPILVVALTVHEYSHALSAALLGDRSAAREGRLTLNPFAHLAPLGLLALFFLGFGWARPVPVNLYNLKRPRIDFLLVALAGPASNIVLCAISVIAANLVPIQSFVFSIFLLSAYLNAVLAVINLLPIPPLDGSRIWPVIFRNSRVSGGRMGFVWVLLILAIFQFNLLDRFLGTILGFVASFVS